jgi:hypothetical protein
MVRPSSVVLLLSLSLLGLSLAGPALAMPPPEPVCGPCSEPFVEASASEGVDVRVEASTATVRVHRNGSATWTVRNRVDDDAARALRANDTVTAVATRVVDDGSLVDASVDGDRVTIRYRLREFAVQSVGGSYRIEYFREDFAVANYDSLGADRLTLVAPEGLRVGTAPPSATVEGDRMTLTAATYRPGRDSAFVTLVPSDALLAPLLGAFALADVLVGVVLRNLARNVAVPTALFAAGIGAVVVVLSRLRDALPRRSHTTGVALAALGAVAALHPLYAGVVPGVYGYSPALLAGGLAALAVGVALTRPTVRSRLDYFGLSVLVAVAFAVALTTVAAVSALGGPPLRVESVVFLLVPALALLPAGGALGTGYRGRAALTALAGFLLGLLAIVPLTTRPMGVSGLGVVVGSTYAVALVVLGWPLLVVGASLARDAGREGGEDHAR